MPFLRYAKIYQFLIKLSHKKHHFCYFYGVLIEFRLIINLRNYSSSPCEI
jgi:hypothetical protein